MLLQETIASNQDFEWYPTTREIISAVANHVNETAHHRVFHSRSILDVGAGDGRVLMALAEALEDKRGRRPDLPGALTGGCGQLPAMLDRCGAW